MRKAICLLVVAFGLFFLGWNWVTQVGKASQEDKDRRGQKRVQLGDWKTSPEWGKAKAKIEDLLHKSKFSQVNVDDFVLKGIEGRASRFATIAQHGETSLRLDSDWLSKSGHPGIVLADKVYLPNRVELPGETLIFANDIILEEGVCTIELGGNLYIAPNNGIDVKDSPNVIPKIITIGKVSSKLIDGIAEEMRMPVTANRPNENASITEQSGGTGSSGSNGECGGGANGGPGGQGEQGAEGPTGSKGDTGTAGGDGFDVYYWDEGRCDAVFIYHFSPGGGGSAGGTGGTGGNGEDGGTGGVGGEGASCDCSVWPGPGLGGNGGKGGTAGGGGNGGDGGDGGRGGRGGSLWVWATGCTCSYSGFDINSQGGDGGFGGPGGTPGQNGQPGQGGVGGNGGAGLGNNCPSAQNGAQGDWGDNSPKVPLVGSWGANGSHGSDGQLHIYCY